MSEERPRPQPVSKLAWAAFASALLAALACLAAAMIGIATRGIHPTWRADELRGGWYAMVLWPAVVLALVAFVLALPVCGSASLGRWRNGWMGNVALVLAVCIGGGVLVAPLLARERGSNYPGCLGNVKNLAIAVQMYATDYDTLPAASTWCDTLMDYVKNPDLYRCPEAPDLRDGYAYNDRLAGARYSHLANPASVVAIFESDRGWNAHGGPDLLPYYPRHVKGDNYGFPDGRAKWVARKPEHVPGQREPRWLKASADPDLTWQPVQKQGAR